MWKSMFAKRVAEASAGTEVAAPTASNRHSSGDAGVMEPATATSADPEHVVRAIRRLVDTHYADEPAFVAELLAGFQRSVPTCLKTIAYQADCADFEGVGRTARTLKSTSRMIGLDRLSSLCRALEVTAGSTRSPEATRPLVDAIREAYAEIRPLLDGERMRILHESALRA